MLHLFFVRISLVANSRAVWLVRFLLGKNDAEFFSPPSSAKDFRNLSEVRAL